MRFAFFGTPALAVTILEELAREGLVPALVVTAPDKPAGRGLALTPPPVKEWARARGIPVIQPQTLKETPPELMDGTWDVFVVAAYGKLLRQNILSLPAHGCVNVHPSLLPKYRGATPIEGQILSDDTHPGITIMLMDEEMDHGPILAQTTIDASDWPVSRSVLADRLSHAGGALLAQVLPKWVAGTIDAQPQDHDAATFVKKTEKEDGLLDLSAPGRTNYLKYLAYEGWPGTYFFLHRGDRDIRVKITAAHLDGDEFVIDRIIPEGKREMAYADFARAA